MREVLLLAGIAVFFVFGWFLMGKLDIFLEANRQMHRTRTSDDENTLRIGCCSLAAADGIVDALERYSESHPDISVCILGGSEEELLEGLLSGEFDVILLPENTGTM